jgi:HD-GYP domain-containing protein (c-di-GMP phosphodiesterase class II)
MGDAFNITLYDRGEYDQVYFSQVSNSIKEQSQQEFLVKDEFDFNKINSLKIHCYDENSANLLKKYLGKDPIAERIVVGGCFIYQNRELDFSMDEDNNTITISSSYNGQGDAYFLVKGNVKVINTKDIKKEIEGGIVMYPTVEVEKTDEAFEVYFIDKRARTTDWLVYSNNIEAPSNAQAKRYHIDDHILDRFANIKYRISIDLNSGLFYANMLDSYHGIAHTSRVLFATHLITSISDGLSDSLIEAAYYAAIIHDLGKTNDREGSIHGLKSMNRYTNFIDNLDMDSSLKQRLKDAIRYHSVEDSLCPKHVQDDMLWKILKDADALDRSRFGGRGCDIKYLRLPIFKTEKGQEILSLTSILPTLTYNCKWNDPYSDIINTLKSYVL